jgi:hypothetical protein
MAGQPLAVSRLSSPDPPECEISSGQVTDSGFMLSFGARKISNGSNPTRIGPRSNSAGFTALLDRDH